MITRTSTTAVHAVAILGLAMTHTALSAEHSASVDWDTTGPWVRPQKAAQLSGVSTRTIRAWVAAGYLRSSKPAGGAVLISRDSLRGFVEGAAR